MHLGLGYVHRGYKDVVRNHRKDSICNVVCGELCLPFKAQDVVHDRLEQVLVVNDGYNDKENHKQCRKRQSFFKSRTYLMLVDQAVNGREKDYDGKPDETD